jgi:SAM-dependent methyltransferase
MNAGFAPVGRCWVCDGSVLTHAFAARYELSAFADQDPPLAAYTGEPIEMRRCRACGFAQPAALPQLERYFDRIYDQRWAEYWVEAEHTATYKDDIFSDVLRALEARVPPASRRLLDIGAHAGRLMSLAQRRGWAVEGIELNPRTAAQASISTGAPVHHGNIFTVAPSGAFDAVTLIDVLEHIPDPRRALERAATWLRRGGAVAVKVPNGVAQQAKERTRALVQPGYRPTLADNLVHVNHFTPASLTLALERSGFAAVEVVPAAPEMPDSRLSRLVRRGVFAAARGLPGALHTPLALNLLATAVRA